MRGYASGTRSKPWTAVAWSGKGEGAGVVKGQRSVRRRSTTCLMQGQETAIGDGRQEGGADPCRSEETAGVRRKDGRKWENSEGRTVFIPGQSSGWAEAGRVARWGGAKPDRWAAWLEAGKSARFTGTEIIL